mmetsp:Transcript_50953/g.115994  ORF Transcript_50953/g.115994 Transcript_50953/m.115994 type:complete len:362 (-) Transcript_50953:87-1172(-)
MLSGCAVEGQIQIVVGRGESRVVTLKLVNDGTVSWPQHTSLQLAAGPSCGPHVVEVPVVEVGSCVDVELEVCGGEGRCEMWYVLVDPSSVQAFGSPVRVMVEEEVKAECLVVDCETVKSARQGEYVKCSWVVCNSGRVAWPEDARITLFYQSVEGCAPEGVEIPSEVLPGQTVEVEVWVKAAEDFVGSFTGLYSLTSPSDGTFGEVLKCEFEVEDFPYMKAEEQEAEEQDAGEQEELKAEEHSEEEGVEVIACSVVCEGEVTGGEESKEECVIGRVSESLGKEVAVEAMLKNCTGRDLEGAVLKHVQGCDHGVGTIEVGKWCAGEVVHVAMGLKVSKLGTTSWVVEEGGRVILPALSVDLM